MGMHEIEDLVKESVVLLSESGREDLRDVYASLYRYQALFDTGYTHFSVMDRLLAAQFIYALPLELLPKLRSQPEVVAVLQEGREGAVGLPTGDTAYWKAPLLYIEAGSGFWQRIVDTGELTGKDAISPVYLGASDAALAVVMEAEKVGNRELIAHWYAAAPLEYVVGGREDDPNADMSLAQILTIVLRTEAYKISSGHGVLELAGQEQFEELEDPRIKMFFENWYKVVW